MALANSKTLTVPATLSPPIFPRTATTLSPIIFRRTAKSLTVVRMAYNAPPPPPPPPSDRLISAVAYTLPFLNSFQYSGFLWRQYPKVAELAVDPILPLLAAYESVPYGRFAAFFALYLVVASNSWFSRYTRFNAMQAVALGLLQVVPFLVRWLFRPGPGRVLTWGYNLAFVLSVLCVVYGFVCSVLGKTANLPFVSDAAIQQL